MSVGKALGRGAGQSPHSRRPADLAPFVTEFDEALDLEAIEMLAHGHRGDAEAPRDLGGGLRPASLELEEDALLRARVMLHDMRCYRARHISQVTA